MKSALNVIALGLGGLSLAVALSLGVFALAGRSLGEPATVVQIPASETTGAPEATKSPSDGHTSGPTRTSAPTPTETETETETPEPSATPSSDDHGGGEGGEPGSGGSGGGDDSDD